MTARRYVIAGGGMAADAAAQALHEADPSGRITILSAEAHLPYSRPPLSKALWKGEALDSIWRGTEKTGARILLDRRGVSIDRMEHEITDSRGEAHGYDALLIATGGTPARLPGAPADVLYYRTVDDYQQLRRMAEAGQRFAVIGGGFIGSEVAAALRMNGKDVVMLFPEGGIGARVFPREMSEHLAAFYREKGVEVHAGTKVARIEEKGPNFVITAGDGTTFTVDGVVAGIGIRPNIDLAHQAGLAVDDGIIVNDRLQTNDAHIYAAGDVARFPAAGLQQTMRVEHEDAALSMGRTAGLAMAGRPVRYTHLPFFYSDLFELGYEAVGIIDSRLESVAQWKDPFKEGVVYYTDEGMVCGVLLVNTWGQVDKARDAITSGLTVKGAAELLSAA